MNSGSQNRLKGPLHSHAFSMLGRGDRGKRSFASLRMTARFFATLRMTIEWIFFQVADASKNLIDMSLKGSKIRKQCQSEIGGPTRNGRLSSPSMGF